MSLTIKIDWETKKLEPPRRFVWIWWEDTRAGDIGFYDERQSGGAIGSVWLDDGHGDPGAQPNWFMWDEGNYSCDCNRGTIFLDSDEDFPCGEGRFEILARGVWAAE
jgi:hypothetical protein